MHAPSVRTDHSSGEPVTESTCAHRHARRVRLPLSYAEANLIRVRVAAITGAYVSPLRRDREAWIFLMCHDCSKVHPVPKDEETWDEAV